MKPGTARFKRTSSKTKSRNYIDLETGEVVSERAKDKILKGYTKEVSSRRSQGYGNTANDLKLLYQNQHVKDYGYKLDKKTLNDRMKGITKRLQSRNESTRTKAFLQLQTKAFRDKWYKDRADENFAFR